MRPCTARSVRCERVSFDIIGAGVGAHTESGLIDYTASKPLNNKRVLSMECNQCGTENPDDASVCSNCGYSFVSTAPNSKVGDIAQGTAEAAYYDAAIGPKNTEYYRSRFVKFDDDSSRVSWNWPAFFITFYWLLYRKMWAWAALYFFLPIVVSLVGAFVFGMSETLDALINVVYLLFSLTIVPMYANALYHRHLRNKISEADSGGLGEPEKREWLAKKGGTSNVALIIFLVVIVIGIGAAIALPAYQDYIVRSQMTEPLQALSRAKTGVAEYVAANGRFPPDFSNLDLGLGPRPDSNVIASIAVDNSSPASVVRLIANVHTCLWEGGVCNEGEYRSFHIAGEMTSPGVMNWVCLPGDALGNNAMENKYLPANCRAN